MRSLDARAAIIGSLGLLLARSAGAQVVPAFRVDSFTTEQGLPSQSISDIAQTGDGFLWVATGGLLARYDGVEFRTYAPASGPRFERRVAKLHTGLGDTLWILDEGRAVYAMAAGRLSLTIPPGGPWVRVVQDGDGTLYGVGYERVFRLRRGTNSTADALPGIVPMPSSEYPAYRDAEGAAWITDSAGGLRRVRDAAMWGGARDRMANPLRALGTADGSPAVLRMRFGRPEVVALDGRAMPDTAPPFGHGVRMAAGQIAWFSVAERRFASDVGENGGAVAVRTGRAGFTRVYLVDRSGCGWYFGLALYRVCPIAFRTITPPLRVYETFERGPREGVLAWDASGRLVDYAADGTRRPFGPADPRLRWARAFQDARGREWWALSGKSGARPGARIPGWRLLPQLDVDRWAPDPDDSSMVWYAAGEFVHRAHLSDSGVAASRDSTATGGRVTALAAARGGVLWATVKRADFAPVLLRIASAGVRSYGIEEGMPPSALRAVRADSDGTIWIGTYGAGLVRLRAGRFRTVREADGLGDDVVTSLLDDGAGNLWMGGNRSVHRVARTDLEDFLAGRIRRVRGVTYGRRDGLQSPETPGFSGLASAGRLWLPTIAGAAVVDPRQALAFDSAPPIVHVLGVQTEHDTIAGPSAPATRLTRGARRLTFTYAGVDLRDGAAVRYEYRLDGVDDDWIFAGHSREATYTRVGPGWLTFHVRATNAGGIASVGEATLRVEVPPQIHERPVFFAAIALAAALLVWSIVRIRIHQAERREAELQLAVTERTASLGEALRTVASQADQLRTLDEAKSRFFANVSHEFRTPLSLIVGPVEDLRDGRHGELPERMRGRLDGVLANARRLLQLVEQLLDIARLESGKLHLSAEERDLVPLLRRMAESFASLADRRGIALRLSFPAGGLRIRHDPDQMEKVIANLVGNALKFTARGGSVEVKAYRDPTDQEWVVLEVCDTGPGIAPEHHERIFDRFFQVDDSERRSHEGTGIGLALVRELVDLHGGTIQLRSAPGEGSTFTVRLPAAAAGVPLDAEQAPGRRTTPVEPNDAVAAEQEPLPRAIPDRETVLVVEDNADLLAWLRDHLADRYRVLEAENGVRGLALAREEMPDLIISDVMMPEMDGVSMCDAVKQDPDIDFIPVILLTAKASRASRLSGLSHGADEYLTKPVDLEELRIRAENLIASRRRVRERFHEANRPLPSIRLPLQSPPRDASDGALLDKLSQILSQHLADEAFGVDVMAAEMGMARSTLYRRLEPVLGMSPMDALWEYRLVQAAQWLSETTITVSEIAYGVGFKSLPHFCGRFRARYGETPSAYRRRTGGRAG